MRIRSHPSCTRCFCCVWYSIWFHLSNCPFMRKLSALSSVFFLPCTERFHALWEIFIWCSNCSRIYCVELQWFSMYVYLETCSNGFLCVVVSLLNQFQFEAFNVAMIFLWHLIASSNTIKVINRNGMPWIFQLIYCFFVLFFSWSFWSDSNASESWKEKKANIKCNFNKIERNMNICHWHCDSTKSNQCYFEHK